MTTSFLARAALTLALPVAALAQTGTIDQVSPYPPTPPVQTAGFNGSTSSLIWQQQVRVGLAGQLEGFELHFNGSIGSTIDARVRIGDGWNTTPVVFTTVVTNQTGNYDEIAFVNCTSANLQFVVGSTFVIELQGHDDGGGFLGSYAPPPLTPAYPEELYLDPGQPGCFADCHWRMAFTSFMNGAPTAPVVYCTSGTTSNNCAASISASANPNVAHTAPCQITISGVEGQKSGILFYGLAPGPQPWCSLGSGTSFLCVKAPTMRTGTQSSGGAVGQCDGVLGLDWNAFQIANPTALGAPWIVGEKAYVQGWFRDPPSCKTTSLSNAVEITYQP